jgi:hypothetical protein
MVQVLWMSPTLLYCNRKFYEIDPEIRKLFHEKVIRKVNPQEDGLYTMYYVVLVTCCGMMREEVEDGPVVETLHDLWMPTLRGMMVFIEDISVRHPTAFECGQAAFGCPVCCLGWWRRGPTAAAGASQGCC